MFFGYLSPSIASSYETAAVDIILIVVTEEGPGN